MKADMTTISGLNRQISENEIFTRDLSDELYKLGATKREVAQAANHLDRLDATLRAMRQRIAAKIEATKIAA